MFAEVLLDNKTTQPEIVSPHIIHAHTGAIAFIFLTQNTHFGTQQKLHFFLSDLGKFYNFEQNLSEVLLLLLPSGWRRLRGRPSGSDRLLLVPSW